MLAARFITSSAKHLTSHIGNLDPNVSILFVYPQIFVSKLMVIYHEDTSRVYRVSFWPRIYSGEQVLNLNTAAVQDDDLYLAVTGTGHKVGVRGSVSYLPSQLINPSPPTSWHQPPPPLSSNARLQCRRPNIECGIAAVPLLFLECSGYVEFDFVCK